MEFKLEDCSISLYRHPMEGTSGFFRGGCVGVRVQHMPTRLAVRCHHHRQSVHRNRGLAMVALMTMVESQ